MTSTVIEIPTFEEGRLRYRMPRIDDLDAYLAFRASERAAGVGGANPDRTQAFQNLAAIVGHWHLRGFGRWLIADTATDAPLGVVGLLYPENWPEPEIAWSVFETAEGKGIAHEAARVARRYAYQTLGWTTVISCIMPDNTRSVALARRLGARHDGDFDHPTLGTLNIWRHPGPEDIA